jgi:predicted permease
MGTDGRILVGRLDRLSLSKLARSRGLPAELADRVAEVVAESGLTEDRRSEVFHELVGHFEDGLAAGRTPAELLRSFGDERRTAALIRAEKRVVTAKARGGTGNGDGIVRRMIRDARYAARRLIARPAFTTTAVLSLALGIGANSAMFTLVNDFVLRPAPIEKPEELVDIYYSAQNYPFIPLAYPDVEELSRLTEVFSSVIASRAGMSTRTDQERAERLMVMLVSSNYFGALGVKPSLGRFIVPDDAPAPGTGTVAVLTDRYWRRAFGADPAVIGKPLPLASGTFTIIGVAPRDFVSLQGVAIDAYLPYMRAGDLMAGDREALTSRSNHSTFTQARLGPGVTLAQARAAVGALAADLRARKLAGWEGDAAFSLIPTAEVIVYPPIDKLLAPLGGMMIVVVGLVLIVACANLAGFLLARAMDRRREIAVRLSIGATRGQLVMQLLVETTLLSLAGGVVGLLLAQAGLRAVLASDLPLPLDLDIGLTIDWRVLTFSVLVSLLAGTICGLAPALQSTRLDLASVIRDESTGGGRSKGVLRGALVAGQVAVAVVLLVAAGLFVRSLSAARNFDPGFGDKPAVLAWIVGPGTMTDDEAVRKIEEAKRDLALLPGVTGLGSTENVHLNLLNRTSTDITIDGVEPPPGEVMISVDQASIDTGYIAAVGLTLERGRNFTMFDDNDAPRVAIVNEAFVEKYWPGTDGLGRRFRDLRGQEIEVVGVVNTAKIRSLAEAPRPFIYQPNAQSPSAGAYLVVNGAAPEQLLPQVTQAIRRSTPELMVVSAQTMTKHLESMSLPVKLGANLISVFALLALVMACIGLYGTVGYAVAQRSREVGIRLSLGADRGAVTRLLFWGGLRLVLAGALIGLVVGVGFGRVLEGLLFGVDAFDLATLVGVPVVLLAVTALAAYLPARRAGRISPVSALKAE